jgi:phosphoribosylformylglycinamidine synthase subunit PurS
MIKAKIYITLKEQVADPQGVAIQHALLSLHFKDIRKVRMGKIIMFTLDTTKKKKAREDIEKMCKKILANPVIEDYRFELEQTKDCK